MISGSHANSPKTADDAYTSASGWVSHTAPEMTIAHADITGQHALGLRGIFVTPDGTTITCDPHLISIGLTYEAYVDV